MNDSKLLYGVLSFAAVFVFACLVVVAGCFKGLMMKFDALSEQVNVDPEIEIVTVYVDPTPMPTIDSEDVRKPWTEQDAMAMAKTVSGEAGNCSLLQQSGVAWNILNRVESEDFPDTIIEVVSSPGQYHGYSWNNEVDVATLLLCEDVLARWYCEQVYGFSYGRTLPKEYLYFHGDGYKTNYFRTTASNKGIYWDWSLGNPYEEE